ncbi:MAG: Bcr/CflA family efflux MFS transporter [Flavobacteriaceae bacterium]|nr:Bcr/CflA family efflux MFS transporter [Flavobacteriaceae bacterium]
MAQSQKGSIEFIALMASLMSVVALAIDALLPALDVIGLAVNTQTPTENQLIITMIFLGLGIGPLIFGPLSDNLGRKPVVYFGFILFLLASFICVSAETIEYMIAGRILQGIGLSAPRTISIAIIRDQYQGDPMARIMSFVTVVFLLVPIVAPAIGKLVLDHFDWQSIFLMQLWCSGAVALWFWKRQPETLAPNNKRTLRFQDYIHGLGEVFKQPKTMGYTLISGLVFGSFMVYLSGAQQIFHQQYDLKEEFPLIFAGLSIAIGLAIFSNGHLVMRFGMKKMVTTALYGFFGVALLYVLLYYGQDNPGIEILMLFFALQFFAIGFLFGNLRALAMQPMGHIAGMAAAITGFISTIMALPISTFIGTYIEDQVWPIFLGFTLCGVISLIILPIINKLSLKEAR